MTIGEFNNTAGSGGKTDVQDRIDEMLKLAEAKKWSDLITLAASPIPNIDNLLYARGNKLLKETNSRPSPAQFQSHIGLCLALGVHGPLRDLSFCLKNKVAQEIITGRNEYTNVLRECLRVGCLADNSNNSFEAFSDYVNPERSHLDEAVTYSRQSGLLPREKDLKEFSLLDTGTEGVLARKIWSDVDSAMITIRSHLNEYMRIEGEMVDRDVYQDQRIDDLICVFAESVSKLVHIEGINVSKPHVVQGISRGALTDSHRSLIKGFQSYCNSNSGQFYEKNRIPGAHQWDSKTFGAFFSLAEAVDDYYYAVRAKAAAVPSPASASPS